MFSYKHYIDSRYKKDYKIAEEELEILGERAENLQHTIKELCNKYLESI
ncbi:MAG: hypothetical protein GY830_06980 [Bacteroidetes bacterium]|nr:hypothetical protein [Bacteroidota bacterium]